MWNVSKNEEILDFKWDQFEADTVMFSIYHNSGQLTKIRSL